MSSEGTETAEWNWCMSFAGLRLHHVPDPDEGEDWPWMNYCLTASCGRQLDGVCIPSLHDRVSMPRCKRCCTVLGYPQGDGSPKNDVACRPLVAARLAAAS